MLRSTNRGVIALSLLALSFLVFARDAPDNTLTLYASNFPPYEIQSPLADGLRGFDVEVIQTAFESVGQSVRFKFRPWKRVVHLVKAGKGAGMFSCVHTKEREQYLLFSDPISAVTRSFAVNKEYTGAEIKRFADVSSLKVVVVSGYATEKELANANIAYEAVINDKVALNLLFFRNFDAFYTTKEAMLWKTKEAGNGDKIRFFDIGQSQTNYHLCLGKNWPGVNGLLVSFNEGLAQIKANGVLDAIHAKYR